MKKAEPLVTTSGGVASPEIVDVDAIEEALRSAKTLLDRAVDNSLPADQALHWQLVRQLTSLQLEYQRIRAWLDKMQAQLSHREAVLRRRLREALALADQVDAAARALGPDPRIATADPALSVSVLGHFAVYCQGRKVSLGSSKSGRAIFRYLVTLSERSAPTDVLLDMFWAQDEPQEAKHSAARGTGQPAG